jgi:hypothetical protein
LPSIPTWRTRSLYLCSLVTEWSSYTPRHRVLFSSPSTSRRAIVEVFDHASTRAVQSVIGDKLFYRNGT